MRSLNAVLVKKRIENVMGDVLIGKITITKSSHRPTNGFVGTLYIIQGRGGACSSRLFVQKYNRVNMIGHNDIIFNRYTRKTDFD